MTEGLSTFPGPETRARAIETAASLAAGVIFTLGLLAGMTHFGHEAAPPPPVEFDDLHAVAMPIDPPPPVERPSTPATAAQPLTGIEPGTSDSPVKIAVVPPDFAMLFPATDMPPAATIRPLQLDLNLKPKVELLGDLQHVYQRSEVDQIPKVLVRPDPVIPAGVRNKADQLHVTVLFIVNINGSVVDARVVGTSGNPGFDDIIIHSMMDDWVFTPAIKRGRKVRCLMQEGITVRWSSDSPFSL